MAKFDQFRDTFIAILAIRQKNPQMSPLTSSPFELDKLTNKSWPRVCEVNCCSFSNTPISIPLSPPLSCPVEELAACAEEARRMEERLNEGKLAEGKMRWERRGRSFPLLLSHFLLPLPVKLSQTHHLSLNNSRLINLFLFLISVLEGPLCFSLSNNNVSDNLPLVHIYFAF